MMTGKVWVDVEDLFEYARENPRPSGIQRLAFEIYEALQSHESGQGRVHFVRHAPLSNSFRVIPWSDVAALFARLTEGRVVAKPHPPSIQRHGPGRQRLRKLVQRLPTSLRPTVIDTLLTTAAAARAWGRLLAALLRGIRRTPTRLAQKYLTKTASYEASQANANGKTARAGESAATAGPTITFEAAARPGDVILVLGSPWFHPDYAGLIRGLREKQGLRLGMLVYDLIPLRRPEWCDAGLVRLFRSWFDPMLPLCDHLFAISKATASDVTHYAAARGIPLAGEIIALPLGTGLNVAAMATEDASAAEMPPPNALEAHATQRALPAPGTYALIVSTIEARKNHLLLFRVWRRLLEDLPPDQVPTLVFAGRVGWLVDDLMRQISNTDHLNGKLVLVESPTDAELAALYRGCLFTMFPSFYEGWGLPVTESLALGKPCLISNRTSLPEAGGTLARSFDPDNLNDAYAAIRNVIEDRAGLALWEEQVRRDFKPIPWSATVDALLRAVGWVSEAPPINPLGRLASPPPIPAQQPPQPA